MSTLFGIAENKEIVVPSLAECVIHIGIVERFKKCSTSCMPGQGAEFTPCRVKADKICI